jgi:hypothetical protein
VRLLVTCHAASNSAAIARNQLLAEMKEDDERAKGGGDLRKELQPATLSGLGVTTTQSSRWQKIGALDDGTSKAVSHCKKSTRSHPSKLRPLNERLSAERPAASC